MGKRKYDVLSKEDTELAKEWHPIKNNQLTANDITCGTSMKAWWLGKCGHEWEASVQGRFKNRYGCPYCAGIKVLKGFNDLTTTNKELAEKLLNIEDGYRYGQFSMTKVDWKCHLCSTIIKDKSINNMNQNGFHCPRCSDGKSYPEKFMHSILSQIDIDFTWEKVFKWSGKKRYDFFVNYNDKQIIIETHGEQHYQEPRGKKNKREALENIQKNDKFKEKIARENGIDTYIIVDCRKSEPDFIKKSILKSELCTIFNIDSIDWKQAGVDADKSILLDICAMWEVQNKAVKEIASIVKMAHSTVRRYLKKGYENKIISSVPTYDSGCENRKRKVVSLDKNMNPVYYDSNIDASRKTGISKGNIFSVCEGKRAIAGGLFWLYKEDYEKHLSGEKIFIPPKISNRGRRVVQLDMQNTIIKEWETSAEAGRFVNTSGSTISGCCNNKRKTVKGFKWMYKDDYDKMKESEANNEL